MSDTALTPSVSTRKTGAPNTPKPATVPAPAITYTPAHFSDDVPGEIDSGDVLDDLTETEAAVIMALRLARKCEGSWTEYHRRAAWELIEQATAHAGDPESIAVFAVEGDGGLLEAAATANANAIAFLMEFWKGETDGR